MKITDTVQSELDLVKQKQKEKNWSQKLELDIVLFSGFHSIMQLDWYSLI